jgi:hypothetical protein
LKILRIPHYKIREIETSSELTLYTNISLRNHGFDLNKEIIVWTDYLTKEEVYEQEDE